LKFHDKIITDTASIYLYFTRRAKNTMTMRLGLDFGSQFVKLSYAENNTPPRNLLIKLEECVSRVDIPSILGIDPVDEKPEIVSDISHAKKNGKYNYDFHTNIREKLHEDDEKSRIVKEYLGLILSLLKKELQLEEDANLDEVELTIAVPLSWYRDPNDQALRKLSNIFVDFGFDSKNISFQAEPICAAACFVKEHQSVQQQFNLLICDIGGQTSEFYLCQICENHIDIVEHNVSEGFSGTTFDDRLVSQYAKRSEVSLSPKIRQHLLEKIEEMKRDEEDNELLYEPTPEIKNLIENEKVSDSRIYILQKGGVSLKDVWDAFHPIHEQLKEELYKFKNQYIDQIMITGGFSQYPLVHTVINDFIEDYNNEHQKDIMPLKNPLLGISEGAVYLASGEVPLFETYKHDIVLTINGLQNGQLKAFDIPIVNSKTAGLQKTTEVSFEDHKPLLIEITPQNSRLIIKKIKDKSSTEEISLTPQEKWPPPPGQYRLKVKIDRFAHPHLIFYRESEGEEYSLRLNA
jgi:molecular chaperone DnaK (HSP70)